MAAVSLTFVPSPAHADGINEWATGAAGKGEVWAIPQVLLSLGDGTPQTYYLQFQIGLAEKLDLVLYPAFPILNSEFQEPGLDAYARYSVTETLMVGLGASVMLGFDDAPSIIAGLFQSLKFGGDAWKVTWNLVGWVPPTAPDTTSLFAVGVVNRKISGLISAYGEVDLNGATNALGDTAMSLGGGIQLDFGDVDALNFGVLVPINPLVGKGSPVVLSAWYLHGFGAGA